MILEFIQVVEKHPATSAAVAAVLAAAVGLGGYQLGIRATRRQEYNAIVTPIRERLIAQRSKPNAYTSGLIEDTEFDLLDHYLSRWRRRRLRAAYQRYLAARDTKQDAYGQVFFKDPQKVSSAASVLLGMLPLR